MGPVLGRLCLCMLGTQCSIPGLSALQKHRLGVRIASLVLQHLCDIPVSHSCVKVCVSMGFAGDFEVFLVLGKGLVKLTLLSVDKANAAESSSDVRMPWCKDHTFDL